MQIELIELKIKPDNMKIGRVYLMYEELMLRCDLVYHAKSDNVWIRMPEIWTENNTKKRFCFWPNKEVSDIFQKIVIHKIYTRYNLNKQKIAEMHRKLKRKNKNGHFSKKILT